MAGPARWGAHLLVQRWVRETPDAVAVRDTATGRQLTYAQLWDASGAVAGELARRGTGAGAVVAVALPRGPGFVVAALGIVRAGAAYLPLDPAGPAGRWTEIASAAGAAHVVIAEPGAPAPDGPAQLALAGLPGPGGAAGTGFPDTDVPASQPLCVNFTSGTTGRPKGVVVPHRAVHRLVTGAAYCPLGPDDVVGSAANPAFDATTFEVWSTLTAGATIAVVPDVVDTGLDGWLDGLRTAGVTTMFLTTSLFHMIARERPGGLHMLRTLLVGGEQLEISLARRVLEDAAPARLVNVYGPTETTTFATFYDCTPATLAGAGRVPVGHPIQDTWIDVVDAAGDTVADGTEGELVIGGPGVALGYIGQPDLTAERFVTGTDGRGVRYRTGDQARRLTSGAVEVLGRHDRQVKMRGFRIELPEIEEALLATGMVDVAVVEKAGDGPSAFLAAFVLPAPGQQPSAENLRAALAPVLPDYMIPNRWQIRDVMPLGPTGKTDRAELLRGLAVPAEPVPAPPEPAASRQPVPDGPAAGPAPDGIIAIWCEVLGVDTVDVATDFIGMGGNSILAVQVSARIRETLAVACEPMDVLLADDVSDLASRLYAPA